MSEEAAMTRRASLAGFCLLALVRVAGAYEYPLQFTPNAGSRGLVVAGYRFDGAGVIGNCSYYTEHSGSGKGGGYRTFITRYDQTCTWDLYGNLVSVAPGSPAVPQPVSTSGTETIYAFDGSGDSTGTDTRLPNRGFVNTPGAHYSWDTANAHMVVQNTPYTFTVSLTSDGDIPLNISAVTASTSGAGSVAVDGSACMGEIPVGSVCGVSVTYNAAKLRSPTGLAYDTLTLSVTSNAPQASDFIQSYTIVVPVPIDDGGN
jgi:hypothetical protein